MYRLWPISYNKKNEDTPYWGCPPLQKNCKQMYDPIAEISLWKPA
jgi:hypothetical protein